MFFRKNKCHIFYRIHSIHSNTFLTNQLYILYSEQYFSFTIDMVNTALQLISVWKKVPLCSLLYYLLLTAGYSITMVSIKLFITVSMMIGNIIDIYLSGIMIVLINWLMYSGYFGLILCWGNSRCIFRYNYWWYDNFSGWLFFISLFIFLMALFLMDNVALSHNVGHWINALVQFYWSCCDRIKITSSL